MRSLGHNPLLTTKCIDTIRVYPYCSSQISLWERYEISIHDYAGLTFEQIEAREAYLARHPEAGMTPEQIAARGAYYAEHPGLAVVQPLAPARDIAAPPETTADHSSPISTIFRREKPEGREAKTGRFAKGWSGRPKGSRNKATQLLRALESESEHLFHHLMAAGISGDSLALRVAVTRLLPARRDLPVDVGLPVLTSTDEVIAAMSHVVTLVGDGTLTPTEGVKLTNMLHTLRRALHLRETTPAPDAAVPVTSRATSSRE